MKKELWCSGIVYVWLRLCRIALFVVSLRSEMFKHDFKLYKRRRPPPDLSEVIDFSQDLSNNAIPVRRISPTYEGVVRDSQLGLKPVHEWRVYELTNRPGLFFIPNPFTVLGQRYWVCRCLKDFTCPPQKLNLDAHGDLEDGQSWWDTCMRDTEKGRLLLQKLRWATLGYHHNWDTKMYSENSRDPFPQDLAMLCQYIARVVGFDDFSAEAAIVNYYHMDSTLSGHTDNSEQNKEAPLFSFSFGQSAVFLLGGRMIVEKPTALLIRSGDVVIMSGLSRLCYHGVPRILSADKMPWNDVDTESECLQRSRCDRSATCDVEDRGSTEGLRKETNLASFPPCYCFEIIHSCVEDCFWEPFGNYLRTSRINMNVRQVLLPGVKSLDSSSEL